MRAVGPAPFAQRADEVLLGPAADARLRMRRDVGTVEGAERRLQRAPAGERLTRSSRSSVWQPTQPAAFERYFAALRASPCCASAAQAEPRSKSPAAAGPQDAQQTATVFRGSCRGSRRRPCRPRRSAPSRRPRRRPSTPAAACRSRTRAGRPLPSNLPGCSQIAGSARVFNSYVLGARVESVPRHLRQVVEERRRCAGRSSASYGDLALGHAADRSKVLANQGHGGLALLHQDLRLDLREGRASDGAQRHDYGCCNQRFFSSMFS